MGNITSAIHRVAQSTWDQTTRIYQAMMMFQVMWNIRRDFMIGRQENDGEVQVWIVVIPARPPSGIGIIDIDQHFNDLNDILGNPMDDST